MNDSQLYSAAKEAAERSYSPYSGFRVGAALLCGDGAVYTGVNIENSAYPVTVCAERTAIFKAVSEGKTDFKAIAVFGADKNGNETFCPPCGSCRQVMSEFCDESFRIILKSPEGVSVFTLGELLPLGFKL